MKFIAAFIAFLAIANAQNWLFVSQTTWFGDGTQESMDSACWTEANGQTIGKEFIAAIANIQSPTPAVYPRVSDQSGPVINTNGEILAEALSSLWPQGAVDIDQYELGGFVLDVDGNQVPDEDNHVWTGSVSLTSAASGADCSGWSSLTAGFGVAGNAAVTDANWWLEFFDFCNGDNGQGVFLENRVYCIQNYDSSQVIEDPVFDGFDGSHFEFQGLSNQIFNLISSYQFNLNALFVPFRHGTVMGAAGITIGSDEIYVDADRNMTLNGNPLKTNVETESFSIIIKPQTVTISSGAWTIEIRTINKGDRIDIKSYLDSSKLGQNEPHGVLGQTVQNIGNEPKTGKDKFAKGVIEGSYTDYLVADGIFGMDFEFNRFNVRSAKAIKRSFNHGIFQAQSQ